MTRLLHAHPLVDAELDDDGRLVAIRWNGRRTPVEVCNRWRVEEDWWRTPIARDYFKVVGRDWLALIYLDRVENPPNDCISFAPIVRDFGTVGIRIRDLLRLRATHVSPPHVEVSIQQLFESSMN